MQAAEPRSMTRWPALAPRALWLALAFGVAALLLVVIDRQPDSNDARWPTHAGHLRGGGLDGRA